MQLYAVCTSRPPAGLQYSGSTGTLFGATGGGGTGCPISTHHTIGGGAIYGGTSTSVDLLDSSHSDFSGDGTPDLWTTIGRNGSGGAVPTRSVTICAAL